MNREKPNSGSCLCGAVHVTVTTTNRRVDACHCNMCRKWSGGPLLSVECGSDVTFEGAGNITVFDSSQWAARGFCQKCGTHLFYRLKKEGHYAIPTGLLGQHEQLVFDKQIFVDEKPSFYSFSNETKNLTGAEVFAQYAAKPE